MIARTLAISVRRVPGGLTASQLDSAALRLGLMGRPLGVGARVVTRDAPDRLMARTFAVSVRRVPRGLTASRLDSASLRLGLSA